MRACAYGPADAHGTGPTVLRISGLRPGAPPLHPLARHLLPAGEPIARVHLLVGGPLAGCGCALPDLRELRIDGCCPGAGGWDAFFAQLLPAAPHLTHLAFAPAASSCGLGGGSSSASCSGRGSGEQLPLSLLAGSGQLQRLELRGMRLAALPAGPYLAGERATLLIQLLLITSLA